MNWKGGRMPAYDVWEGDNATQKLEVTPRGLESTREALNRETRENRRQRGAAADRRYEREVLPGMVREIDRAKKAGAYRARYSVDDSSWFCARQWCWRLNRDTELHELGIRFRLDSTRSRGRYLEARWGRALWLHRMLVAAGLLVVAGLVWWRVPAPAWTTLWHWLSYR